MKLIIDIESNALMELTLDAKGQPVKECSKVHLVVTKDVDTNRVYIWKGEDLYCSLLDHLNSATVLIGHNIYGFDLECLVRMLGYRGGARIYDTLVVSKVMHPDRQNHPFGGNSLADWGKHLGTEKIDYQGTWEELTQDMIDYCVQDVHVCHAIYDHQQKWLKQNQEFIKVVQLEHKASEVIFHQQHNGFNFDLPKGEELIRDLTGFKAQVEDEMRTVFPDKVHIRHSEKTGKRLKDKIEVFNPASRQQIAERLFEKYGWVAPKTDNGNPNVDASVLEELDYPEAKKLVEYFDVIKLMGQVEDWITRASNSRDGKVHGFVNEIGRAHV